MTSRLGPMELTRINSGETILVDADRIRSVIGVTTPVNAHDREFSHSTVTLENGTFFDVQEMPDEIGANWKYLISEAARREAPAPN